MNRDSFMTVDPFNDKKIAKEVIVLQDLLGVLQVQGCQCLCQNIDLRSLLKPLLSRKRFYLNQGVSLKFGIMRLAEQYGAVEPRSQWYILPMNRLLFASSKHADVLFSDTCNCVFSLFHAEKLGWRKRIGSVTIRCPSPLLAVQSVPPA